MASPVNSVRHAANRSLNPFKVCRSCIIANRRRRASTAAATANAESDIINPPLQHLPPLDSTPSPSPAPSYQINAGVILSRPPILTRDLHPFEKAYFLYQRRLNERLSLPFTRYFYYEKNTPGDLEWKRKIKERLTPSREIGKYGAYGREGWNDELLVGDQTSEPEVQQEALVRDAESTGEIVAEGEAETKRPVDRPLSRTTEADQKNDTKSLDRALQRTLFLLVKGPWGWRFPFSGLIGKEDLKRAAERIIVQAGGVNMNTWIVGNAPVVHHKLVYPQPRKGEDTRNPNPTQRNQEVTWFGEKTFLMKARIMAGQAKIENNALGLEDFQWLTKEEVEKQVQRQYWKEVQHALADR
ncbi:54S ribosomal protein L17 mitochondrial [Agyrium rufum]|nr:54S ribosomal protein L17 mitochondrial [Agyrium rufum]